jgi:hypothetical protein
MDLRVVCTLTFVAFTAYLIAHWFTEVDHCQVEVFIFLFMSSAVFIPFDRVFDRNLETDDTRNYIVFLLGCHTLFVLVNKGLQAVGYFNFTFLIMMLLSTQKLEDKHMEIFLRLSTVIYFLLTIFTEVQYVTKFCNLFLIVTFVPIIFFGDKFDNMKHKNIISPIMIVLLIISTLLHVVLPAIYEKPHVTITHDFDFDA